MSIPGRIKIRSVWAHNLDTEFHLIQTSIDRFNHISMDTEFPGIVSRPTTAVYLRTPADNYAVLKSNVDALNLIQVGLTLSDQNGNLPTSKSGHAVIWEFNFKDFDLTKDNHAPDSIALLKRQGIDFAKNSQHGIDSARFAELMWSSGLLCNNNSITWVTFHGAYDFGYLVKILTGSQLPESIKDFLEVLEKYFGTKVYDLKHIIRFCKYRFHGGLDKVATAMRVDRAIGKSHQAGSDSLLTWQMFHKTRDLYLVGGAEKHAGKLYGLEVY